MLISKSQLHEFEQVAISLHLAVASLVDVPKQRPQLTNYINKFLGFHGADPRRTSFSISVNAQSKLHVDCHNEEGAYNSVISLGEHCGGELWMDARCQPLGGTVLRREVRELPSGEFLEGHVIHIRTKMTTFDPHYYHEVLPGRARG